MCDLNMGSWLKKNLAAALRKPEKNTFGYFCMRLVFPKRNTYLEQNAVKLCDIQPHHEVLEIGFGNGFGLKAACERVKAGSGKIYGVDYSKFANAEVSKKLKDEIASGKLSVSEDSVLMLPFDKNQFDRVFHTNCFYFWDDMDAACNEIYRVMKPDSFMVTCMNMDSVKRAKKKGLFDNAKPDPLYYMLVLERNGFENVNVKYLKCETTGQEFAAIHAHIKNKFTDEEIRSWARQDLEELEEQRLSMSDSHL